MLEASSYCKNACVIFDGNLSGADAQSMTGFPIVLSEDQYVTDTWFSSVQHFFVYYGKLIHVRRGLTYDPCGTAALPDVRSKKWLTMVIDGLRSKL